MDSVKIRKRAITNGNVSLFLEYYEDGKRTLEALNLYLVPERDEHDKLQNDNALKQAVLLKAEKTLGIEREEAKVDTSSAKPVTLVEYLDKYLENRKSNGAWSHSHIEHISAFVNLVKEYLKKRKKTKILMGQLSARFAQDFITYVSDEYKNPWSKTGGELSPSHKHNLQQYFVTMLNVAVREGVIRVNPFKALDKKQLIPKAITSKEYLTIDEMKSLMKLPEQPNVVLKAFLFACFTGLRRSDIQKLTWNNIKSGVSGQYVEVMMEKTKRLVTVPLSNRAMSYLPEQVAADRNEPIFAGLTRDTSKDWIKRYAKQASIEKNVFFHMSRHTFATLSLSAGVDIATISAILGHSSLKVTQIYAEVIMKSKIAAVQRMTPLM